MGAAAIPALIGAVASIGGTIWQGQQQQAAIDAQNRAQQQAMQRSAAVRREAAARDEEMRKRQAALNDEALSKQDVESVTTELEDTKAKRSEAPEQFAADVAALSPGDAAIAARPGTGDTTTIVNNDLGTRLAQASQNARTAIKAKSDIGAYDQLFQDRARGIALTNEQLNQLNKKRQGWLTESQIENEFVSDPHVSGISAGSGIGPSILTGLGSMFTDYAKGGYG